MRNRRRCGPVVNCSLNFGRSKDQSRDGCFSQDKRRRRRLLTAVGFSRCARRQSPDRSFQYEEEWSTSGNQSACGGVVQVGAASSAKVQVSRRVAIGGVDSVCACVLGRAGKWTQPSRSSDREEEEEGDGERFTGGTARAAASRIYRSPETKKKEALAVVVGEPAQFTPSFRPRPA